jgi:hypothetical protein
MIIWLFRSVFKGQKKARLGAGLGSVFGRSLEGFVLPDRWARRMAVGRPTPPQANCRTGQGKKFSSHFRMQAIGPGPQGQWLSRQGAVQAGPCIGWESER